jgi:hypothetical protein
LCMSAAHACSLEHSSLGTKQHAQPAPVHVAHLHCSLTPLSACTCCCCSRSILVLALMFSTGLLLQILVSAQPSSAVLQLMQWSFPEPQLFQHLLASRCLHCARQDMLIPYQHLRGAAIRLDT